MYCIILLGDTIGGHDNNTLTRSLGSHCYDKLHAPTLANEFQPRQPKPSCDTWSPKRNGVQVITAMLAHSVVLNWTLFYQTSKNPKVSPEGAGSKHIDDIVEYNLWIILIHSERIGPKKTKTKRNERILKWLKTEISCELCMQPTMYPGKTWNLKNFSEALQKSRRQCSENWCYIIVMCRYDLIL